MNNGALMTDKNLEKNHKAVYWLRTLYTAVLVATIWTVPVSAEKKDDLPYADKIIVKKAARQMLLISNGKAYRQYVIGLGDVPEGHKQQRGDERTPEGLYIIDYRNPKSQYHLSLHINYPSALDKKRANERGVNPGGDIFIHGLPNGMSMLSAALKGRDWTDGCIAVDNNEIEEIWRLVKNGTPIEILP
jgi:murein L,D-transpeptidase YafK